MVANGPKHQPTPEQQARLAELQRIMIGIAISSDAMTAASRQMTVLLGQLVVWFNEAGKENREDSK